MPEKDEMKKVQRHAADFDGKHSGRSSEDDRNYGLERSFSGILN